MDVLTNSWFWQSTWRYGPIPIPVYLDQIYPVLSGRTFTRTLRELLVCFLVHHINETVYIFRFYLCVYCPLSHGMKLLMQVLGKDHCYGFRVRIKIYFVITFVGSLRNIEVSFVWRNSTTNCTKPNVCRRSWFSVAWYYFAGQQSKSAAHRVETRQNRPE